MDQLEIMLTHLRADAADARGRQRARNRHMQRELRTVQSALRTGHLHVAKERVAALLTKLAEQLED